jgi:hypothetical protein
MKKLLLVCLMLSLTGCVRGIPRFPLPRVAPVKVTPLPRVVKPPVPAQVAPGMAGARRPFPVVSRTQPETRSPAAGAKTAEDNWAGHMSHFGGHLPHLPRDEDNKDRPR